MLATSPEDAVSEFIRVRTYARWLEEESRRETWEETVDRYVNWITDLPTVREAIKPVILNRQVVPSMRAVWSAGKAADKDNTSIYNCGYISIDSVESFSELLYILMCGTGVGFSCESKYIYKLPSVSPSLQPYGNYVITVDDSKEGWAKALNQVLGFEFIGIRYSIDYSFLRPAGARLATFGGRSSGPEPLKKLIDWIHVLFEHKRSRHDTKLTPIEAHDLCCNIAEIVVVGGVRRSSMISLSDFVDPSLREAKVQPYPIYRAMANNSAVYYEKPSEKEFADEWFNLASSGTGERGIFNYEAATKRIKRSRRGERDYFSNGHHNIGINPCGEILLRDKQFCNLSEIILREDDTPASFIQKVKFATLLGVLQASKTYFPHIRKTWANNCEEEQLLGVSITGQYDNIALLHNPGLLERAKRTAIETAAYWAHELGTNISSAVTCVKPSGCQVANTLITTSKGLLYLHELNNTKISSSWKKHNIVVATDGANALSTNFYVNGFVPTKQIKLKSGLTLEASLNHKYRVIRDNKYIWVKCSDLKLTDKIAYTLGKYDNNNKYLELNSLEKEIKVTKKGLRKDNSKFINQPSILNEDIGWLLGLYFGDGSNHNKGIRLTIDDEFGFLSKAKKILKNQFNINAIISYEKETIPVLYANSKNLLRFLKENSLLKSFSHEIEIPIGIRKSPPSVIESFINGFWAADGSKKGNSWNCNTTSKIFATQLVLLLRAIGYDAKFIENPPTNSSYGTRMRYLVSRIKSPNYIYKNICADIIESINDSQAETFDIEVPEGNTYLANSYISHNTVSQLTNTASGAHPRYASYYYRRYRISGNDPLFHLMKDCGFEFTPENGQYEGNASTWVCKFPVKAPSHAKTRHEISALDQINHYLMMQKEWTEHNTSMTVYVKDNEWGEVGEKVYENFDDLIALAFLPEEHVYEQPPYEEIDKFTYEEAAAKLPVINYRGLSHYEKIDQTDGDYSYACMGAACEL